MGGAVSVIWVLLFIVIGIANMNKKASEGVKKPAAAKENIPVLNKPIAKNESVHKANHKNLPHKATVEKTHSHVGEVSETILMEDRQNDWLAMQIKEEAKVARRNRLE